LSPDTDYTMRLEKVGIDLIAGSMSTGSHDGDSPGPARPWDR